MSLMKALKKILLISSITLLITLDCQYVRCQITINGNSTACIGNPEIYNIVISNDAVPDNTGASQDSPNAFLKHIGPRILSVEWTVSGGTIISGQESTEVTVQFETGDCSLSALVIFDLGDGVLHEASIATDITGLFTPFEASTITGSGTVSAGASGITYSVPTIYPNVTAYIWTLPSGASIVSGYNTNSITVNFSASAISGNISVFGRNACGDGLASSKSITIGGVLPSPAGTISGNTSVCPSTNGVVYTVSAIAGATGYAWSVPSGSTITTGGNTNSITVNFSSSAINGNVSVYGTNSVGNGSSSSKYIIVGLPGIAGTISGNTSTCLGTNGIGYSVPSIPGATGYVWTLPAGASIALNNSNSISVNYSSSAVSGNISVYGTNACGNGTPSTKFVTISGSVPAPAGAISGSSAVISGWNSISYSVPPISGATSYYWTLPSGASFASGVNTNSITVNYSYYATSGNISVYGVNSCGNGTGSIMQVTINAVPYPAGAISGQNEFLCPGASGVKYWVSPITGATGYTWTLPAGASIASGNNTNIIYVNYSTSVVPDIISVCGTNSFGNGQRSSLFLTTYNFMQPAGSISGNTIVSSGASNINYSIPTIYGATGYVWTLPSGCTIASGSNTKSITVNFSPTAVSGNISVFGVNSCGNGNPSTLAIIVQGNKQIYQGSFVVNGDKNTYYPVVFKYGNQDKINHLRVFRSYGEAGPTTIDAQSLTHRGGLTLEIDVNYGGWGGSTYDWRLMDLRQTYHETFAGALHAMHNMGFIVWLRGGGFLYHYESDYAANLQVAYSSSEKIYDNSEPSYIVYAPTPKVTPDITNIDLHRTGVWKSYNGKIIFGTGKIGIGTSNPNYLLSVKGIIGTNELVIEDLSNWPDFVFKPNYQLRSLNDLEKFIKENNHLPDIPTSDEVLINGINLGEMNSKLLQKVEELTLYIIEQNKVINNQKSKIDLQNHNLLILEKNNLRINELEKKINKIKRK